MRRGKKGQSRTAVLDGTNRHAAKKRRGEKRTFLALEPSVVREDLEDLELYAKVLARMAARADSIEVDIDSL